MKTIIQVEIDHKEPLPQGITDALADRAYQFVHAKGGSTGDVVAKLMVPEVEEDDAS